MKAPLASDLMHLDTLCVKLWDTDAALHQIRPMVGTGQPSFHFERFYVECP